MSESKYIIRSEEDAYEFLKKLVNDQISLGVEDFDIEFSGWPTLNVYAKGKKFDQTITPSMMKGFLAFQSAVYRAYAISKYNTPNLNNLTKQEKDDLEIQVKVEKGSSDYNIDFQELATKFIDGAIGKMTGEQMLIVGLAAMLLLFGHFAIKNILEHRRSVRAEELSSEEQRAHLATMQTMSQEETKRMELMQTLIRDNAKVDNIYRAAYDANMAMLKGLEESSNASLQGVDLTGGQAHLLVQNAHRRSNDIRLDGRFRILGVDSSLRTDFRIRVLHLESSEEFMAQVQEKDLTMSAMSKLQEAEWKRRPILLHINAKDHNGTVKHAVVYSVGNVIDPEESEHS